MLNGFRFNGKQSCENVLMFLPGGINYLCLPGGKSHSLEAKLKGLCLPQFFILLMLCSSARLTSYQVSFYTEDNGGKERLTKLQCQKDSDKYKSLENWLRVAARNFIQAKSWVWGSSKVQSLKANGIRRRWSLVSQDLINERGGLRSSTTRVLLSVLGRAFQTVGKGWLDIQSFDDNFSPRSSWVFRGVLEVLPCSPSQTPISPKYKSVGD